MSDNLRLLAKYSAAMDSGDTDAVYEFWSDDFHSHVTGRVTPDRLGTDVRGEEVRWWKEARSAFPDMTFTVDLLIESDDLVVSNWTVKGTHTGAPSTTFRHRGNRWRSTAPPSCGSGTVRSSSTGEGPTARRAWA